MRSDLVNFSPLSCEVGNALSSLQDLWPDAAERLIRPCPFCATLFEQNNTDGLRCAHITGRYHIRNADSGQQMTVEISRSYRLQNYGFDMAVARWA